MRASINLLNTSIRKQRVPGRIHVEPALNTEPACRDFWDVQEAVPLAAYPFRTAPVKETMRCAADVGGI